MLLFSYIAMTAIVAELERARSSPGLGASLTFEPIGIAN